MISMRDYLSTHMLFGARHLEQMAHQIEAQSRGMEDYLRHKSCVVGAVILSASFLEAAINELLKDCHEGLESVRAHLSDGTILSLAKYWETSERKSILTKYQGALQLAKASQFDRDANPYQAHNSL
jgi:hypothetical protein